MVDTDASNPRDDHLPREDEAQTGRANAATAQALAGGAWREESALVATESPLTLWIEHGPEDAREESLLGVTMRTPGHDEELALGLLRAEGLIRSRSDVRGMRRSREAGGLRLGLAPEVVVADDAMRRAITSSACGVCGRGTLVEAPPAVRAPMLRVPSETLLALPDALLPAQVGFRHTGGLHAAGAFDASGTLLVAREDVGRHNALDKVSGALLSDQQDATMLLVSSRASYELVVKAAFAGVPILAAVGAATDLAIETARAAAITLVAFLREERMQVLTHDERIAR